MMTIAIGRIDDPYDGPWYQVGAWDENGRLLAEHDAGGFDSLAEAREAAERWAEDWRAEGRNVVVELDD